MDSSIGIIFYKACTTVYYPFSSLLSGILCGYHIFYSINFSSHCIWEMQWTLALLTTSVGTGWGSHEFHWISNISHWFTWKKNHVGSINHTRSSYIKLHLIKWWLGYFRPFTLCSSNLRSIIIFFGPAIIPEIRH